MKFFVDTADIAEIRELQEAGLIDGVTTNPSLVMKANRPMKEIIREICDVTSGPVSAEVAATEFKEMMREADVLAAIAEVDGAYLAPAVADYVLDIVQATRTHPELDHGASPRAARTLVQVAKAYAAIGGRDFVTPDDVKAVSVPVLAHRLGAVARRGTEATRRLVAEILVSVPAPTA